MLKVLFVFIFDVINKRVLASLAQSDRATDF